MDIKAIQGHESREKTHFWHAARRHIVEQVITNTSPLNNKTTTILDVGCGAGINTEHFNKTFSCTGIEPDSKLIKQARNNSTAPILTGGLPDQLPKINEKFDFILLLDVLEHIKEDKKSLVVLKPLLKPSGKIIINVPALPALWSVHDELYHHQRRYTKESLHQTITQADLQVKKIRYWSSISVPLTFVKRRIIHSNKTNSDYRPSTPPHILNNLARQLLITEYNLTKITEPPFGTSLLAVIRNHPS